MEVYEVDLKDQLTPSFADEETDTQRREMLVTYTKLFSDLTGAGIHPLTPRPVLKPFQPVSSTPHFLLPLFQRNVLPDVTS